MMTVAVDRRAAVNAASGAVPSSSKTKRKSGNQKQMGITDSGSRALITRRVRKILIFAPPVGCLLSTPSRPPARAPSVRFSPLEPANLPLQSDFPIESRKYLPGDREDKSSLVATLAADP